MLSFTRKAGQAILIGDKIKITVKEVRGHQARLVIEAPREIPVFREELYKQIAAENARAAAKGADLLKRLD